MIKVKNIKTGEVFDVIKVSGEYWIDDTGYIESEQLGITWELIDDYKQLYEQQIQRADELEKRWSDLREWLDEQSSEYMTKYRKSYNERDDEKSETYNEIFNKMTAIEKENNNA